MVLLRQTHQPGQYEYEVSFELNVKSVETVEYLRTLLNNGSVSLPLRLDSTANLTHIEITTVCSSNASNVLCRCEEDYVWPYDNCTTYQACDEIVNDTCTCIKNMPPGEQYCQPKTAPFYIHTIISIEFNATDMKVINLLRDILRNTNYPLEINSYAKISDANITTVCSPSSGSYQCRCEEQYRWPSDQCFLYGSCDNITNDTCGCINAIPFDGNYCQSVDQHVCSPGSGGYQCRCEEQYRWPCDQCFLHGSCDNIINDTCGCIDAIPSSGIYCQSVDEHVPSVDHEYVISIELTTPNMYVVTLLRNILLNATYPIFINNFLNISDINLTTVCSSSNGDYQCRCENLYSWTCDQCSQYGSCGNITKDPCGCINTIPSDGMYCQSIDQHNATCLIPITSLTTLNTTKVTPTTPKTTAKTTPDPTTATTKATTPKTTAKTTPDPTTATTSGAVFLSSHRPGSVITDFTIRTSQVNNEELTVANEKLPEVMRPIGPVIGGVTVRYRSTIDIEPPSLTYTGRSMTLRCGPPPESINLGTITAAKWKLNGKEIQNSGRTQIASSGTQSVLTVNNVILADKGLYECNLMGSLLTFVQVGRASNIRQAPNVRVPGKINVKCSEGGTQSLQCCVQRDYTVKWFQGSNITCRDRLYGNGRPGDISTTACDPGLEGSRTAQCQATGEWILLEDNCILTEIKDLLIDSEDLVEEEIPEFAANLSKVTEDEKQEIVNSSATISAIVGILSTIAAVSTEVEKGVMEDVLQTVDVLISDDARESWEILRENVTRNDSSELLNSLETLSDELVGEFTIRTGLILLNTTTFDDSFSAELNSSVTIDIPNADSTNISITTIIFATLDNVLPPRNSSFNSTLTNDNSTTPSFNNTINAAVALVRVKADIQNVTLSFKKDNNSLTEDPQCVFWNFSLFDNFGAWDDEGCTFVSDINNTVTCNCNHLTSFSILMATDIPEAIRVALDVITYVGVGISIASLLICLIIEGYVWKALTKNSTAFMRHVCIVNTALSLLIADICFIIAASYAKNPLENPGEDYKVPLGPCTAATFFMHFFYLALFFWMLASGLLLLYRTVMVFSHMSKSVMMAIGFLLGYVCPLIIAVVTVAATAPGKGYIRENDACWLNWVKTKALLALVIPALTIVAINFLIVIVIVVKMLRRSVGDAARIEEKHTLAVVFRCVIILTPLFGLTWGLGIGTMVSSTNKGIHIAFAFFNSLQGFFILVFGTLLDAKIRVLLAKKRHVSSSGSGSNQTASTSAGSSSLSGLKWFRKLRGKKHVYRVSDIVNSSSSGGAESFSNI
nr:adhesion G protein-coupled receptor F5-like [Nerophis lumbriciformis]